LQPIAAASSGAADARQTSVYFSTGKPLTHRVDTL
jgi:hypothetical protein